MNSQRRLSNNPQHEIRYKSNPTPLTPLNLVRTYIFHWPSCTVACINRYSFILLTFLITFNFMDVRIHFPSFDGHHLCFRHCQAIEAQKWVGDRHNPSCKTVVLTETKTKKVTFHSYVITVVVKELDLHKWIYLYILSVGLQIVAMCSLCNFVIIYVIN